MTHSATPIKITALLLLLLTSTVIDAKFDIKATLLEHRALHANHLEVSKYESGGRSNASLLVYQELLSFVAHYNLYFIYCI
jgi:hypothetical protein